MTRHGRTRIIGTVVVTLLVLAGCDSAPDAQPITPPSGHASQQPAGSDEMPTKRQKDVEQVVKSYADATAAMVGAPLTKWEALLVPCETAGGDLTTAGQWHLSGHANIALEPSRQITELTRMRDQWKQKGYEITEFRTFPPDSTTGVVTARNPDDRISISVESTVPGTALALLITTPCYQSAPGEHTSS